MRQGTANREQRTGLLVLALALVALVMGARAQDISFGGDAAAAAKKGHVLLLSDSADVAKGKEQVIELRFRVDPGFHINSHTPKDPLLIATVLKLDSGHGVDVLGQEYPKGAAFKLGQGTDGEVLDVYQGEFRVKVRVKADAGDSTLTGALHYQACDDAACFPPKTLAVKVAVTGK
jgi:Disulphide bond corrector protein DsbC